MEYVAFGKTSLRVSRIGFGGAPAGLKNYVHSYDPGNKSDRDTALAAIDTARELGVNYFDTAPGYGNGESERLLGEALGNDSSVVVATKVWHGETDVSKSVGDSLDRLQRDRIDLLQIHGTSYTDEQAEAILAPGGLLDRIEAQRARGLVRFVGFTTEDNNPPVYRFIRSGRFDVIQLCYNFLFQHPCEPSRPFGSLYESEMAGLGIAAMRAPTSGTFQRWIAMVNPANSFDYTPALIQFVLSNPMVDVALVGMRSPERVRQNVGICNDLRGRIDIGALHGRYV